MGFDPEIFVSDCQAAAAQADALAAVREVVSAAVADRSSIDAVLGAELPHGREEPPLFCSGALTVQRILWPPGITVMPHEHRMWAVVGVYGGEELNRIYERSSDGLKQTHACVVAQTEVLVLDADAIHSVENPRCEWTAGLHVYGGDMVNVERNGWGPDGREVPSRDNIAAFVPMLQVMHQLCAERETPLDDEARYLANRALTAAWERERLFPSSAEARRIIAHAWQIEA